MNILIALLVGLIAGVLAGVVVRGRGYGILVDILVGLAGALIGGLVFSAFGFESVTLIGNIVSAFVGAVILLLIIKLLKKA